MWLVPRIINKVPLVPEQEPTRSAESRTHSNGDPATPYSVEHAPLENVGTIFKQKAEARGREREEENSGNMAYLALRTCQGRVGREKSASTQIPDLAVSNSAKERAVGNHFPGGGVDGLLPRKERKKHSSLREPSDQINYLLPEVPSPQHVNVMEK